MIIQPILDLVSLLHQKGIRDVVICPGSRSAHLSIAFKRHGGFELKTVFDERSAGYLALGMSLATKTTTVLVCTSGTAAMNFAPAICEAFYQKIPLIVITADRPAEWIDQGDGQSIRQQNLFHNHVKKSFHLPSDFTHEDSIWAFNRLANEAIELAVSETNGPVHLNIPIREPFYPEADETFDFKKVKNIEIISNESHENYAIENPLFKELAGKKIILFCGQCDYDNISKTTILNACKKNNIVVIAESIANFSGAIGNHDLILKSELNENYNPEILLTIGDAILSKAFKQFIRKNRANISHWHIERSKQLAPDVFKCLEKHVAFSPFVFFNTLQNKEMLCDAAFYQNWVSKSASFAQKALPLFEQLPYGEFKAIYMLLSKLENKEDVVHVANSMPIRYVNMIPMMGQKTYCNRGTSGIDGSNSTAVGFALKSKKQNWLITGDMSFLYDKNAFWHPYPFDNLKILVLNNAGGGIFRMIDGPSKQPELNELFVTHQTYDAASTAEAFGFQYLKCENKDELTQKMEFFLNVKCKAILEVFSDGETNKSILKTFMATFS